jgi:hypothetical protein
MTGHLAAGDTLSVAVGGVLLAFQSDTFEYSLGLAETITTPGDFSFSISGHQELGPAYNFPASRVLNGISIEIDKGVGTDTTWVSVDPGMGVGIVGRASAVPEPASLTLFGLGACFLAGCGWRRRKTLKRG